MKEFEQVYESFRIRRLRFMSWVAIYEDNKGNAKVIGWAFTQRGAWKIVDDYSLTLQYLREGRN